MVGAGASTPLAVLYALECCPIPRRQIHPSPVEVTTNGQPKLSSYEFGSADRCRVRLRYQSVPAGSAGGAYACQFLDSHEQINVQTMWVYMKAKGIV